MEKEIYTPMERVLIEGAIKAEEIQKAYEIKEKERQALELDLLLLELESKIGLMDGIELEEWLL